MAGREEELAPGDSQCKCIAPTAPALVDARPPHFWEGSNCASGSQNLNWSKCARSWAVPSNQVAVTNPPTLPEMITATPLASALLGARSRATSAGTRPSIPHCLQYNKVGHDRLVQLSF